MSGPERQESYDSLLDLDILALAAEQTGAIEVIDNISPTLPPDKFPHIPQERIDILPDDLTGETPILKGSSGVPDKKMPVGQEETTQPYSKVDLDSLYDLELHELLQEDMGDKIAKLLG